jgi:hypothetical protein
VEYRVEPIGAQFSKKDLGQLGQRFTQSAQSGWRLHSVFQAQQPGCSGIGTSLTTYFAIYVKE